MPTPSDETSARDRLRRNLVRLVVAFAVVPPALVALLIAWFVLQDFATGIAERREMRERLEALPGIRVVDVEGDGDVGDRSPIPALAALGIRNVADLLDHYDEVATAVSGFPEFPAVAQARGYHDLLMCYARRTLAPN